MAISGTCCLVIGLLYGGSPVVLLLVAAIWGATVVADSAQFSSCITELGDPQYIGTALTIQMCIGFLLTTVSIELVPKVGDWRYAFVILAPGPLFGVISMLRLRALPEAVKIAHGRRWQDFKIYRINKMYYPHVHRWFDEKSLPRQNPADPSLIRAQRLLF